MTSQEINTTIAAHDGYVKQRVVTNSPLYATKVTYYMVPDDPDYFKDANIDKHLIAVKRDWGTDIKHTKTKVHGGYPYYTSDIEIIKGFILKQPESFQIRFDDLLKSRFPLVHTATARDWCLIVIEILKEQNDANRQKD